MALLPVGTPLISQRANEVKAVVSGSVGAAGCPRAAVVVDFDADVIASADDHADGEGAAGQARVAVESSVGSEFGGAEDHVVCDGAVVQ